MSEYKDFTSLPPDKEREFIVFEKQSVETSKRAMKIGMIVAGIFGLITVVIVFSFTPPKHGHQMADDDMGMLKRAEEEKKEEAKKKEAPAAESEGAEESAEGSAEGDGEDGEESGDDSADGDPAGDDSADDDSADDDSGDDGDSEE